MAILPHMFYRDTYHGVSISADEWPRIAVRADEQLRHFERIYTVTDPSKDGTGRNRALCAIADQMYTYEAVADAELAAASSVSIGSVSTSVRAPSAGNLGLDMSEAGQTKAFYRIAQRYLDIYRGVGGCRR